MREEIVFKKLEKILRDNDMRWNSYEAMCAVKELVYKSFKESVKCDCPFHKGNHDYCEYRKCDYCKK